MLLLFSWQFFIHATLDFKQILYGCIFDVLVDGPISSMNISNENSPDNFYAIIKIIIRNRLALSNRLLRSKAGSNQGIFLAALQRQARQYAKDDVEKAYHYQLVLLFGIRHRTRDK